MLRNPALIAEALERRRQGSTDQQSDIERERQLFNKQVARCDKELHKWEQAYLNDVIDVQEFKERKADVMKRRGSVERELARLSEQEALIEQAELEMTSLSEYCKRVHNNL